MSEDLILVIDSFGVNHKILHEDALNLIENESEELVEVSENVFKILDPKKEAFRKKKSKIQQKSKSLKTIRVGINISDHDLSRKVSDIKKFLSQSHPVKVEMILKGRQQSLKSQGIKTLEFVALEIAEYQNKSLVTVSTNENKLILNFQP